MRIIHTADWHIGKILHKQDLHEDHVIFFDWLVGFIDTNAVNVLIVSGDIFDLANPSGRDLKLYYEVLKRITDLGTRIILTGGNHDGISMLNAPKTLLHTLNISVTGGVPDNFEDQIIPLGQNVETPECVVLAVPFLRDRDLRLSSEATLQQAKSETIRLAIRNHYDRLILSVRQKYGDEVPLIAMGHLYMSGSLTSDSEREIHIGNLEGMPATMMSKEVDYWALGHIHKAQIVGGNAHMRYSGSPVYLDFSERQTDKKLVLLDVENKKLVSVEYVDIPIFRQLIRVSGTLNQVTKELDAIDQIGSLTAWVELAIREQDYNPGLIEAGERLVSTSIKPDFQIIKSRISFENSPISLPSLYTEGKSIEDLSPMEIFEKKLEKDILDEVNKDLLREAHHEILSELMEG